MYNRERGSRAGYRQPVGRFPPIRLEAPGGTDGAGESRAALSDLYDQSSGILYALALRIVQNAGDAEETLHDAYWRAWRYAGTYSAERGSVLAWLVLMTRSCGIDRLRATKRHNAALSIEECFQAQSPTPSPETEVASNQKQHRIRAAMRQLSEDQREAIDLGFFGGLTHSELAAHLGVPLGTIKTRIRTGLQRMRASLGDFSI